MNLPEDILYEIFFYCLFPEVKNILKISLVCNKWKKLLYSSEFFWQRIFNAFEWHLSGEPISEIKRRLSLSFNEITAGCFYHGLCYFSTSDTRHINFDSNYFDVPEKWNCVTDEFMTYLDFYSAFRILKKGNNYARMVTNVFLSPYKLKGWGRYLCIDRNGINIMNLETWSELLKIPSYDHYVIAKSYLFVITDDLDIPKQINIYSLDEKKRTLSFPFEKLYPEFSECPQMISVSYCGDFIIFISIIEFEQFYSSKINIYNWKKERTVNSYTVSGYPIDFNFGYILYIDFKKDKKICVIRDEITGKIMKEHHIDHRDKDFKITNEHFRLINPECCILNYVYEPTYLHNLQLY